MDPVTTAVGAYSSIRSAANTAMEIKKATAKTSITRLTKDQIFQFPMIMSSDISSEENYHIVKTIERNYATLILAAITNEGVIDRDKYGNINQFLKRFHDNLDLPFATESDTDYEVTNAVATEGYIPQEELRRMDATLESQLDCESINDMYRPFERTKSKVNTALEAARAVSIATEATDEYYFRVPKYARDKKGDIIKDSGGNPVLATDRSGNVEYMYVLAPEDKDKFDEAVNRYGASPRTMDYWRSQVNDAKREERDAVNQTPDQMRKQSEKDKLNFQKRKEKIRQQEREEDKEQRAREREEDIARRARERAEDKADRRRERAEDKAERRREREEDNARRAREEANKALSNVRGEMMKDVKFGGMMPTVLTITLANMKKEVGSWSQQLIIGIRAVPRYLSPSIMIANMCEAFKDRAIFNFLKFTKGELKWWDAILGLTSSRNRAISSTKNRWMKVLKARAEKNSKSMNKKYNPNTTIVITENEATLIKESCGIDPNSPSAVRKVMDKYFLLAFAIYDTEAKMMKIIFDGDVDYTHYSLRAMAAEAKKETDLTASTKKY